MNILQISLLILLAYFLGSIPTAVWVGKIFFHTDVREHGSGNAGATNVIRVLGYSAGIPVLLFDVLKGWLAVKLTRILPLEFLTQDQLAYLQIALALAAVLGHIYPIWAGFRGGKGVGTLAGVGLALYPWAILIGLAIFILVLATTRYVSVSSMTCAILFPFIVFFITGEHHTGLLVLAFFIAVFVPWTHRSNIRRLLKKEEKKFDFRRRKDTNQP